MNDVAEFLTARLDEDEAMAQAANGPRWTPGDGNISEGGLYAVDQDGDGWAIAWFELGTANEAADGGRQLPRWPKLERHAHSNSVHAARHDPARVLREVEAKRRIIAMHHSAELACPQSEGDYRCCEEYTCQCQIDALDLRDAVEVRDQHAEWPCPTVRALAAAYADHPDYDPEWR